VARDTLLRAQQHDDLAQAGVKSQLKPSIDLARSQAEVAAGQLEVIRSQNSVRVAHAALDTAIGWAPPADYSLAAPAPDDSPIPDEAKASDTALASRFDLTALHSEEKATDYARLAAESGNYPRLLASSSLSLRGFDAAPVTPNWDVGLVLTVPLFTGFNVQGQVEEQEAREADLQAREAALKQGITYQIRQARETLLSARQAEVASQAQVKAAKTNADLAAGRYREGLGNIVDLTDAEAELDVAQSGLVQSRLAEALSRVQLNYATGSLRPHP
jgi:outer membrane protein TolC